MMTKFTMNALAEPCSRIIPQITEAKCAAIRESVSSGAALTGAYLAMDLAAGLLIGMSTRDFTSGSETLGRTCPSLVDLLIALAAGFAGVFTFLSTGLSGVVIGVAMETALVHALTTAASC
jgi:uncharacterized membrane protein